MKELAPLPDYDFASLYPNKKALSSSQIIDYLKDPAEFYAAWVYGDKRKTHAMDVGRIFSAAYADRKLDYAAHLQAIGCRAKFIALFGEALSKFPIIPKSIPEFPMIAAVMGYDIRATLDDFKYSVGLIVENKTGKMPWTQERADSSPQITIQCWCYWKKHGKLPKHITLNWWNTGITSYVDIKTFTTKRTVAQMRECEELLGLVIEGIEIGNFTNKII